MNVIVDSRSLRPAGNVEIGRIRRVAVVSKGTRGTRVIELVRRAQEAEEQEVQPQERAVASDGRRPGLSSSWLGLR